MIPIARWLRWSTLPCFCAVAATGAQAQSLGSQPSSALVSNVAAASPPPPDQLQPQPQPRPPGIAFVSFFRDAEWYFSWGYNKEFWANSDIHVSQPGLGNDFTIHNVQAQDDLQQLGDIFTTDLFGRNITSASGGSSPIRSASNSTSTIPNTPPSLGRPPM
jgi:hypothetical protein